MLLQSGHDTHHKQSFFSTYVWSEDHKMIGKQFMFTALLMYAVGGLLALGVRGQLGWPETAGKFINPIFGWSGDKVPGEGYNMLFTMHASVMIFLVIIPMLNGAFANYVVPLQIGARDMAFPFLNALSYWTYVPAILILASSFFVEGGSGQGGWTSYPPLAEKQWTPGTGQTLWLIGAFTARFTIGPNSRSMRARKRSSASSCVIVSPSFQPPVSPQPIVTGSGDRFWYGRPRCLARA